MTRRFMLSALSITVVLVLTAQPTTADPTALREDIQVRHVVDLPGGTFRISKDPRDNTLYIQVNNGTISRVVMVAPEDAIGETIAQGRADASGTRIWTRIMPAEGLPADVPIDAIREADASGTVRAGNPTDDKTYQIASNGNIVVLPRTVVGTSDDYGINHPRSLYIGDDGTFYITLDLDIANAASLLPVASRSDHGFSDVQGFDIGPDGSFYIGANTREGGERVNNIVRGTPDGDGQRTWTTVAVTEAFPNGTKNHDHPGIVLSPDGRFVFLNSGSRTDHGEIADADGFPPGIRELPLSPAILRVPSDGEGIVIPADEEALAASGYLYADGFRNAFDMAFAPNGDMFAGDNGPDGDQPDGLMWVREGHHFGFPWRMGGIDNPQRFPDYDPAVDNYIQFSNRGITEEWFYNDPDYPPPPMAFSDPVINLGPDADRLRDPETGDVIDASDAGVSVMTFTPHSSPLGIVFDVDRAMSPEFNGDGFLLRTGGDCCSLINSFNDPDEDLLHLDLEKVGDNYQARVTRLVEGFAGPLDAEIIGNRIFVIERSGSQALWEITLPAGSATAVTESGDGALPHDSALGLNYPNPFNPETVIPFRVSANGSVELTVYDLAGQKIRTLFSGKLAAGAYTARWDGRNQSGSAVASGVYLYRLEAPAFQKARRLTLLK